MKLMSKVVLQRVLTIICILPVIGCMSVGPNYEQPATEMPANWQNTGDPALVPDADLVRQWWTLFNDPLLNKLISEASRNNLNLMTAIARVEESRARLGIATGERYPSMDVEGSTTRQRGSENSISGAGYKETVYSSRAGSSWQIDLFGRIRRSVEAAAAQYQASEEDRTDVMITIYADVALTYLDIRTYQARLAAAKANIASQKKVLRLTQSRFKHGLTTDLDVAQSERLLARAEAEVPPLRIALAQGVNNLAVLLGRRPGTLHKHLMTPQEIPLPPPKATVGVPANLLRQRADIRKAERLLAAQTARIGVAKADLYPSLSLTGSFGFESIDIKDLFDAGSRVLSFGPSLRWNIFSGGRIRNNIKMQDAIVRQSLFTYEQTVLNALREVENTLKAYIEDRIRLSALERSVSAARRSVKVATGLYKQGLADFQPVLDAQRDQFDFENQLAVARGNSAANFVRLYTALGGGWDPNQTNKM
ncbi:efflux transporter outer membrane subunit [Desulfobacterales bacterium HSG16]|nr:efflux transporter outer membrane subunit [Desulfobacterales bacterium HSG16]